MKIGDKIIVTNSPYDPTVGNGTIMTVTKDYGDGYVLATVDGEDGYQWCMHPLSFKPYTPDVGTLSELDVKPGHVVERMGVIHTVISAQVVNDGGMYDGEVLAELSENGRGIFDQEQFRIISRAPETPTLWRDMTPEEKGALLLAKHEGKVIEEYYGDAVGWISYQGILCSDDAYRVKTEPKREAVGLYWCEGRNARRFQNCFHTHKITFQTVDGIPQCDTIKMEKL